MLQLAKISLLQGWLPTSLFSLTGLTLFVLIFTKSKRSKHLFSIVNLLIQLGVASIFFIVGGLIAWLISDVFLVFGVSLGWLVIICVAIGFALVGFAGTAFVFTKGWKRLVAVIAIVLTLVSTALRVDMVYGEYTTLGSIFGMGNFPKLEINKEKSATASIEEWYSLAKQNKLPKMPKKGILRSAHIPNTYSKFKARTANVYLPPAALVKHPPKLPVMVMLAGQPGSPNHFFAASDIAETLDDYAKSHKGLAPIVVAPDQNGEATHNSLCADTGVYGKAETYLIRDVPNWIRKNLPVSKDPSMWLMGGFSQGGTCATQLVPAHPNIFRSMYSAGGELEPTYQNRQETIKRYFNGNTSAYERHVPSKIMRKNAPLKQNYYAIAGYWDSKSQANQATIALSAHSAGINVLTMLAKNSGHDWHTVKAGLKVVLDLFCKQTGISKTVPNLNTYPNVKILVHKKVNRD
ncbi:alpha/beta hydrolase-fold protein [Gardnerella greenwoodii]|uniref:alpha/beta hydrolase-fold protein n=1 Tax=Gardnerella greenwoodii TaxID=2914925 RepID=UPI003970CB7E